MAIVSFNIVSGALPVVASISGSTVPDQIINSYGVHAFTGVANGTYTLRLVDANGCIFDRQIEVNPYVTTTTTTVQPGSSIVIGNTQDGLTVFNPDATNRGSVYTGSPDPQQVRLFLWFKTLDGMPLTSDVVFDYTIQGRVSPYASQFTFVELSDQIHAEVIEGSVGPVSPLIGTLTLKTGFIETYFEYLFHVNLDNDAFINISTTSNSIYTGLKKKTTPPLEAYGITTLTQSLIEMVYSGAAP